MTERTLRTEELLACATASAQVSMACACARLPCNGWESMSCNFPEELLQPVGALVDSSGPLTVREYHPHGTSLWSEQAPIAVNYYPANRSRLWQCSRCTRCYLIYTEYGGYYQDKRIRALQPELLVLDSAPADEDC